MPAIYTGVKLFVQQVTGIYFRKIQIVGIKTCQWNHSETEVLGDGTKFIFDIKDNKNFKLGIHCLSIDKKYKLVVEKVIDETHIKVRSDPKLFQIYQEEKNN